MKAIDLFAGCGGNTIGAKRANVKVVWAANHCRVACDLHEANHPESEHSCQDLQQADFDEAPDHDACLASPDCRGHTDARGKEKPRHDKYRATAWAVVSCLEAKRPPCGLVENVPEFLAWSLYPSWKDALVRLGYSVAPYIIDSADHGVPQHRVRLYIILTRSRSPICLALPKRSHVPASSFIDFAAGDWSDWRRLCANTRARVRSGRQRFGNRFLAPYYGKGSGLTGRSLDRPIGTITTKDRWQIVDGYRQRLLSVEECRRAMGFPDNYILPKQAHIAKRMLGQAVCPPVVTDILNALRISF